MGQLDSTCTQPRLGHEEPRVVVVVLVQLFVVDGHHRRVLVLQVRGVPEQLLLGARRRGFARAVAVQVDPFESNRLETRISSHFNLACPTLTARSNG
jgi:hypothetical protein